MKTFKTKHLPILILLPVVFFAFVDSGVFGGETPVNFPDINLEQAIREAIDKRTGPIYESDLVGLTSLKAEDRDISNLTGLEYCTNLTWLYLDSNNISDITPLANLTNLTELTLYENNISGITPLGKLTNLTVLSLWTNSISDITPLVDNSGLGSGDEVKVANNYLDLTPGCDDMQNIQALINRGVDVSYEPQNP